MEDIRLTLFPPYSDELGIVELEPAYANIFFYHNLLDRFCWTIKLHYSPKTVLMHRRHRLDTLLQYMLVGNNITLDKFHITTKDIQTDLVMRSLSQGWHNELARSIPLHQDYLKIGTAINPWTSPSSGGFTTWNIIQSYYAAYAFARCLCSMVQPDLGDAGHDKIRRVFHNNILGTVQSRNVVYPFTLTSESKLADFPNHPEHCVNMYAAYPRDRNKRVNHLDHDIVTGLSCLHDSPASFLTLLHHMRLAANYTEMKQIMKLRDGGYQHFLNMNLSTSIFLFSALCELTVISVIGEASYIDTVTEFHESFVIHHDPLANNINLIPHYIRMRCYKHLNLLSQVPEYIVPSPEDYVAFV